MGFKHGLCRTTEYKIWAAMKRRCYDDKQKGYCNYGARGITVCERWLQSFLNFLEDMGLRPSKEYSIDRIDNDGNYCPENCRWATRIEQNNNSRSATPITFNGETHNICEWAIITGISKRTICARLRYGWTIEDTLTKPIDEKHSGNSYIEYNGKTQTITEWSKEVGISRNVIRDRLNKEMSVHDALYLPLQRIRKKKQ